VEQVCSTDANDELVNGGFFFLVGLFDFSGNS
jgi:hypothetical protein